MAVDHRTTEKHTYPGIDRPWRIRSYTPRSLSHWPSTIVWVFSPTPRPVPARAPRLPPAARTHTARRLLVGRFELLALGRVLVDLAEDLGGWKSVAMVRRYRKVVDERLDDVMDAFNENGEEQISER